MESGMGLVGSGVAKIIWKNKWLNSPCNLAISHSLEDKINFETLRELSMLDMSGTFISSTRQQLSHQLSNQKLIFVPSPTFHLISLWNCWRFLRIHFHTHELNWRGLTMKKFSLIEYLAVIYSVQRHCWLKSFHVSLLKKVLLTTSVFLRPRPPDWLGRQILSPKTIGNPLLMSVFF